MSNSISTINADIYATKNIDQVVKFFGDGKLRESSQCSHELRLFLGSETNKRLAEHANYCLDNKFDNSGLVLQDIINEIVRRIGYTVKNGRYQGTKKDIGNDGLWISSGNLAIVVEIKTTDAYRMNLDKIQSYSDKINQEDNSEYKKISTLIVVGRSDTGDLEAQVRGSRHAWSIRLISIDALLKLMFIKEAAASPILIQQIEQVLLPFEYTRVDGIIDLVFAAQKEQEFSETLIEELIDIDPGMSPAEKFGSESTHPSEQNKSALIDIKRVSVASNFFNSKKIADFYRGKNRPLFLSDKGKINICVAISKNYQSDSKTYWYALHPNWLNFLEKSPKSFFVLGCMDLMYAFALPKHIVLENIVNLYETKDSRRHYWHITLKKGKDGNLCWELPKIKSEIPMQSFRFEIAN